MRKIGIVWVGLVLAWLMPLAAWAADFTHGVSSAGANATLWFKPATTATWVDAHYQVNGGGLQNLRMTYSSSAGRFEQTFPAQSGASVSYFFTYAIGTTATDSARFTATVGGTTTTPPPAPTGAVCFYEHTQYQGASFCADTSSAWTGAAWNDRISSVKVRAGQQVRLFEHANEGGRTLDLTADTPDLVGLGFNDAASSFRVSNASTGTDLPTGNGVMTVKLVNGTAGAYRNDQVYFAIIGYDPVTRVLSHVDRTGKLVPAALADNDAANRVVKNGQSYANYFHKLSDVEWVSLPKIDSGRMFISLGSPMFIKVNTAGDGRLGFAGPDLGNASDPNQDVYFEWIEFTIDGYGYHGNTTRVDQFGFPLRARLIGKDGYDRTLGETQTRAAIFADYEAQVPTEFRSLVRRPYRIVAPGKGNFNHGQPQANYFAGYVDQVWQHYRSNDLVFTAEAGTFRGRVVGDDFVFSKDGGPANIFIRGKPTTQGILEGSGNLAAGNSLDKVVQAQITAAFNRHLLLTVDPTQWSTSSAYYTQNPANHYARFWHDHSIDGLAYGFCYDDVRNKSSLLEHPSPKGLIVTAGW